MKKNLAGECGALFDTLQGTLERYAKPGQNNDKAVRELLDGVATAMEGGEGSIKVLNKFSQKGALSRGFAMAIETRISALLTGIKTHMISPIGGAVTTAVRNVEETAGAVMGRALGKLDSAQMKRVLRQSQIERAELAGQVQHIREHMKTWFSKGADSTGKRNSVRRAHSPWGSLANQKFDDGVFTSTMAMEAILRLNDGKDNFVTKGFALTGAITSKSGDILAGGDQVIKLMAGRARHVSEAYARFLDMGADDVTALRQAREQADILLQQRGNTRDQLKQALRHIKNGRPDRIDENIQTVLEKAHIKTVDDIDAALDHIDQGLKAGEMSTFTHGIGDKNFLDALGKGISNMQESVPGIRLALPFVKTPTNIASETWERTFGIGLALTQVTSRKLLKLVGKEHSSLEIPWNDMARRLQSPDPREAARAIGEMSVGITAMTSVAFMTMQRDDHTGLPIITGTAPSNPRLTATWREAGWQPRSILIGGSYVSYDRLDPLAGAIFGFAADITTAMSWASDDGAVDRTGADMFLGVAAALGSNITSKTWMRGVRELSEMAADPSERNIGRFVRNIGGGLVPGILRDLDQLSSEEAQIKDIRSFGDAMLAKIPGLNSRVDQRRNFMGEPLKYTDIPGQEKWNVIMPFSISHVKDDVLSREFSNLTSGFSMASTKMDGVDLTDSDYDLANNQSSYDRLMELSGQVKIGGRTLRQELRRVVQTSQYRTLDELDIEGERSPRTSHLSKIVNKYRKKARTTLLRENPKLRAETDNRREARRQRRLGLNFNFFQ
jgi:hypothetical protein